MQLLICGAGLVTREVLKRLGNTWTLTLVDKDPANTEKCLESIEGDVRLVHEDASSAVVLEKAGITEHEYVLALTDRDDVNLEITRIARDRGVPYVMSLVHDPALAKEFEALGARVIMGGVLSARHIYHYLEDPRLSVTPLTAGQGEVLEVDTSVFFRMIGKPASAVRGEGWRLAGIFRHGELLLPEPYTRIEAADKLIIVGETDSFNPVCSLLECSSPHFPLAYGRGVLVGMLPGEHGQEALMEEALYVARQTKVAHVEVICAEDQCDIRKRLEEYSHVFDLQVNSGQEALLRRITRRAEEASIGCVVVPPFQPALINRMLRPPLVGLAHSVGCPVLVARNSAPYARILVPFHKNDVAELTLEVALDFAKQVMADVTVIIVEEEDFVHGEEGAPDTQFLKHRVQEIAHAHKVKLEIVVRSGNPVRQILETAAEHDLLVVASSTDRKGLFFPHVGEVLTEEAPCSVLVVTS